LVQELPRLSAPRQWEEQFHSSLEALANALQHNVWSPKPWPVPGVQEYVLMTSPSGQRGYQIRGGNSEQTHHLLVFATLEPHAPTSGIGGWEPVSNDRFPTLFRMEGDRAHAFVLIQDLGVHLAGSESGLTLWAAHALEANPPTVGSQELP
jgi:hypothetical protein